MRIECLGQNRYHVVTDVVMSDGSYHCDDCILTDRQLTPEPCAHGEISIGPRIRIRLGDISYPRILGMHAGDILEF